MNQIEKFISTIRDSFVGSQQVYTEGSCYHFYKILKQVFPTAHPYWDLNHVLTRIDGKFYDITGEVTPITSVHALEEPVDYSLQIPYNIYRDVSKT